jgi:hypothetical protein
VSDDDIIALDDGTKSEVLLTYISEYSLDYSMDLIHDFLSTLETLRE